MEKLGLFQFLNKLESNGKITAESNDKIQKLLDLNTKTLSRIFLILAGFYALLFTASGLFTFFTEGWFGYSKGMKTVLGFLPFLIGGAFYGFTFMKHKDSKMRMETVTMFFAIMMGASIFLIAFAQQMDVKTNDLLKVWLLFIIPLLYIGKSSWIAILYLGVNLIHLQPDLRIWFRNEEPELFTNSMYFWFYLLAFAPHFMLHLNQSSRKQSFRMIFLGWLVVISVLPASALAIKAGHFFWIPALLLGMYVLGKKFYGDNNTFLARPFQTATLLTVPTLFIVLSNRVILQGLESLMSFDRIEFWTTEHYVHFALGFVAFAAITGYVLKVRNQNPDWNKLIIYMPFVVLFLMLCLYLIEYDVVNLTWWLVLVLNLYVFIIAFHAMFQGSNNNNVVYMIFGLIVLVQLMTNVYQNMDRANWVKALFFLAVGGLFYAIVLLFRDDLRTD